MVVVGGGVGSVGPVTSANASPPHTMVNATATAAALLATALNADLAMTPPGIVNH